MYLLVEAPSPLNYSISTIYLFTACLLISNLCNIAVLMFLGMIHDILKETNFGSLVVNLDTSIGLKHINFGYQISLSWIRLSWQVQT